MSSQHTVCRDLPERPDQRAQQQAVPRESVCYWDEAKEPDSDGEKGAFDKKPPRSKGDNEEEHSDDAQGEKSSWRVPPFVEAVGVSAS